MRTVGKILTIVSALALVACLVAVGFGLQKVTDFTRQVDGGVTVSGTSGQVPLAEGQSKSVWTTSGDTDTCTAKAPDGTSARLTPAASGRINAHNKEYVYVGDVKATAAGTYTVTCTRPDFVVTPQLMVGPIVTGAAMLAGGAALGFFAGLALLIGLVLVFVGRSSQRKAQATLQQAGRPPAPQPQARRDPTARQR